MMTSAQMVTISDGDGEEQRKRQRRSRQSFTWNQLAVLQQAFETDPLPRQALLQELSNQLKITPRCAQVWFQNRRQKVKALHNSAGLAPPFLKNATSCISQLDSLVPDLAYGDSQPQSSQPHALGSPERRQAHLHAYFPGGDAHNAAAQAAILATTSCAVLEGATGSDATGGMALPGPATHIVTPFSSDHLHSATFLFMHGERPVFQVSDTRADVDTNAPSATSDSQTDLARVGPLGQLPTGSLVPLLSSKQVVYVPVIFMSTAVAHEQLPPIAHAQPTARPESPLAVNSEPAVPLAPAFSLAKADDAKMNGESDDALALLVTVAARSEEAISA